MKVTLRNAWFGPDGQYRAPGDHDLPEDFREMLPPSAVAEEAPVKEMKKSDGKKLDI